MRCQLRSIMSSMSNTSSRTISSRARWVASRCDFASSAVSRWARRRWLVNGISNLMPTDKSGLSKSHCEDQALPSELSRESVPYSKSRLTIGSTWFSRKAISMPSRTIPSSTSISSRRSSSARWMSASASRSSPASSGSVVTSIMRSPRSGNRLVAKNTFKSRCRSRHSTSATINASTRWYRPTSVRAISTRAVSPCSTRR